MKRKYLGQQGVMLVLTALVMPLVLVCAGVSVDFGMAYLQRARLQNAADAAALAGAKQREILDDNSVVQQIIRQYVMANCGINNAAQLELIAADVQPQNDDQICMTAQLSSETGSDTLKKLVKVELRESLSTCFLKLFGLNHLPVKAVALAQYQAEEAAGAGVFDYAVFGAGTSYSTQNTDKNSVCFKSGGIKIRGNVGTNAKISLADKGYASVDRSSVVGNARLHDQGTSIWAAPHGEDIPLAGSSYTISYEEPVDISLDQKNDTTKEIQAYVQSIAQMSLIGREQQKIYYDDRKQDYQFQAQSGKAYPGISCGTVRTSDGNAADKDYRIIIVGGNLEVDTPENCNLPANEYMILVSLYGDIRLQNRSAFRGIVFAPKGKVWLDCYAEAAGSFVGQQVWVSNNNSSVSQTVQYQKLNPHFVTHKSSVQLIS